MEVWTQPQVSMLSYSSQAMSSVKRERTLHYIYAVALSAIKPSDSG